MKRKILILGAGRSSNHLIQYLAANSARLNISITILDINLSQVPQSLKTDQNLQFIQIDKEALNPYELYIQHSEIVISMLPAFMHLDIAKLCLKCESHLITPSYISEGMTALGVEAKGKNLIFLNEMGFDPGIDHMTTMEVYHKILDKGGKLYSYRSYAGGLVAPKSDNNPWNYKFSWNPRNVILAGQGGEIIFKENGEKKSLSYQNLFKQHETIEVQGNQSFDAYANRDSIQYEGKYGWTDLQTILRGTLRKQGFCKAWNFLIELGLTDDSSTITLNHTASFYDFYSHFYQLPETDHLLDDFCVKFNLTKEDKLITKLIFIGFFDRDSKLSIVQGTPAQILQSILEEKWKLEDHDTDWVVMAHFFEYELGGHRYQIESSMTLEGEDEHFTAMSKTVGMPIALACELILENKITKSGVLMPIFSEVYLPVLRRLEEMNIRFHEKTILLN